MYNYYTYINSRKREAADKHSAWGKTKKTEFTKKAMILAAEAPVEWLLNSNLSGMIRISSSLIRKLLLPISFSLSRCKLSVLIQTYNGWLS